MVKLGVISDIHSDVVALETMLKVFERDGCDRIVCLGDIISIGPFPQQTVERVRAIPDVIAVSGNHDRCLAERKPASPNMGKDEILHHRWMYEVMTKDAVDYLGSLPYRVDMTVENVRITALHFAMDEKQEYLDFSEATVAERSRLFGNIDADVILYGHEHQRSILRDGKKLYVNFGPLGCPGRSKNIARGGILFVEDGRAEAIPLELKYPAELSVQEIDRLKYPWGDDVKLCFYGIRE